MSRSGRARPFGCPAAGQAWSVFARGPLSRAEFWDELRRPLADGRSSELTLETQQAFYERELCNDDTDFSDHLDPGTPGLEVLLESGASEALARETAGEVGLGEILDRGYRLLSTGESRLLLLLREVLREPELLVVEQPFEGLDATWRAAAEGLLARLVAGGGRLVALVERAGDAPRCTTHRALLRDGKPALWATATHASKGAGAELEQLLCFSNRAAPSLPGPPGAPAPLPDPLVQMRDCGVYYHLPSGERVAQFAGFSWELRRGEHTLVTGPNGAGKSTLLAMLSGDHPQCYSNDLVLFGRQRGSGESVWDVKKNVGLVSPSLHRDYRAPGSLLAVVVSGLYDSIGVYRDVPEGDRRLALGWLEVLGLSGSAGARFSSLSWGQQRLVLIARGLIKHPSLLILDEPTQGLDEVGRQLVLGFLEQLARLERTTLLMVTHRGDEHLPLFRRRLSFRPSRHRGVRFVIEGS